MRPVAAPSRSIIHNLLLHNGLWRSKCHSPQHLHVRGNPRWKQLFPHLQEIGVEVVVQKELPKVEEAYQKYLKEMKEARSAEKNNLTTQQAAVEKAFSAIAKWVKG